MFVVEVKFDWIILLFVLFCKSVERKLDASSYIELWRLKCQLIIVIYNINIILPIIIYIIYHF